MNGFDKLTNRTEDTDKKYDGRIGMDSTSSPLVPACPQELEGLVDGGVLLISRVFFLVMQYLIFGSFFFLLFPVFFFNLIVYFVLPSGYYGQSS